MEPLAVEDENPLLFGEVNRPLEAIRLVGSHLADVLFAPLTVGLFPRCGLLRPRGSRPEYRQCDGQPADSEHAVQSTPAGAPVKYWAVVGRQSPQR
jgi:hypothetical protein